MVTEPGNRLARLPALGGIDKERGEFWVENPWDMPALEANLSAFESNRLFLNLDGTSFLDASFASGADIDSDSRSAVAADFDGDGGLDLLVSSAGGGPLRLFANRCPDRGNSVSLNLAGRTCNQAAIGARVVARIGDSTVIRDHFPPNGFMGQGPTGIHIGLGDARSIDELEIRWPGGTVQKLRSLEAGTHRIEEPE